MLDFHLSSKHPDLGDETLQVLGGTIVRPGGLEEGDLVLIRALTSWDPFPRDLLTRLSSLGILGFSAER